MESNLLLTMGAMTLLAIFLLSANKLILNNKLIVAETEYVISAISIGQTLIDEVKTKEFDEAAVGGGTILSTTDLSYSLGSETGETVYSPDTSSTHAYLSNTLFDDVDDYNGYSRIVDTDRAEGYNVSSVVEYVTLADPDVTSGSRTFCKRITVTITSPYITQIPSVQLQYAFTY